jgi:polysaccharide export outer membrane protein
MVSLEFIRKGARMRRNGNAGFRSVTGLVLAVGLSGCGLPSVGPNKGDIIRAASTGQVPAIVVEVDDRILGLTPPASDTGFGPAFTRGALQVDRVRPGDRLTVTVFENVQNGLFGAGGVPAVLGPIVVDQAGDIFVPYGGTIPAAGLGVSALRERITERLSGQTPDPQVSVLRDPGDGATVSIVGTNAQGIYPITQSTAHLSEMIARAGGVRTAPTVTEITVVRGSRRGTIWLSDLNESLADDIFLRDGDRVIVQEDRRRFSLLGAFRAPGLVEFPKPKLSALEAVAHARGLNPNTADPTGVFVLRRELPAVAAAVSGRGPFETAQRMVYVLNLTAPNGLFLAQDFQIRDGDAVYVSEAPYAQFSRVLSALLTTTSAAGSIGEFASGNGN